ncbi:MAG: hypothetical protein KatS3mg115_1587 [Candidatus Poribacteria bacterium]|nr:MAG: hypothetical protein KatS3mg115_1587 [Candidatus Poribacteria bacterium]
MSKEGSTISGLMDTIATMTSIALQYGVPLEALVRKFSHMRFEPQGFTGNPDIPIAKSIIDYVFRWMALKFLKDPELAGTAAVARRSEEMELGELPKTAGDFDDRQVALKKPSVGGASQAALPDRGGEPRRRAHSPGEQGDGVACHVCGTIMLRAGSCYVCTNCGANTGCS